MKKFLFSFLFICNSLFAFQSVVILPFANQSEKQHLYWLGEGFAESLSEELLLKDALIIQRPERLAAYEDLRIPYTGDLSRATMLKIADKLAADYVIFGTYRLKDSSLETEVKAIKLSTSELSNPIRASGSLDNLYRLQLTLRDGLLQYFKAENIQAADAHPFDNDSIPLSAYELYIKALLESPEAEQIKLFERAIELKPEYPQAVWRLGTTLSRLGRYKESNAVLARGKFEGEYQIKVDFMKGLNSYNSGEFEDAYQKWLELSKSSPSPEIYNNVGVALLKKNDTSGAGWFLSKAVELAPENPSFRFNLAASYVLRTYDKHAVLQYREALRFSPGDYQALYLTGKLLERETDPILRDIVTKKVMALFQEKIPADQRGKFPEQYNTVMQLLRPAPRYLSIEEQEYAHVSQKKFLKDAAVYVKTYQASAQSYIDKQDPAKAILEIKKGVTLDPLNWYLHHLWGKALVAQKDITSGIAELQFSVWCQDNIESHLMMAELYRQTEHYADSKIQVQKSLALDPNNKAAMDIWGKIWNKQ